jgi:hypothetical protein
MNLSRIPTGILTGKIMIVLGLMYCAVYPLILLFISWRSVTLSVPLAGLGIFQLDVYPFFLLYTLSVIGFALGIAALMTEDSKKAGKLAVLAGVLSGNVLNWICLPLMIIGGVLCYCCSQPGEK